MTKAATKAVTMRIGELSRRTGVSIRLLRYYEEQGLLSPERGANGYRNFRDSDVGAVRQIRTLLAAGLPTHTIAWLLPCVRDEGERLVLCTEMAEDLRGERARIDRQIETLMASRELLDDVISAAHD
ncbi:DNA-binding transcriptional MerR regulator [Prauserella sediminis]|uniref:DNA-binding transcriptional MerR regulator n=2 Tax=Prauserella salsuginis group TaxID=2893672 RepID=A0A839XND0_9PSEU|nr:MerR family transcriptional regulator [Prauserella sediminis]MBB3662213.1 DNA-binding transcriptional MerR regulator [Prauserella sediminis]